MASDDHWISKDPATRAGLYQHISDVPEHYRLRNYANRFQGKDSWSQYLEAEKICREDHSENYLAQIERRGRRWKQFCSQRDTYHALCSPADSERYAAYLLDEYSVSRVTASDYWAGIERFYRWMFHHAEFPHRYNPFVMAAIDDSLCEQLWRIAVEPN
jgi:hypothetical protein